MKSKYCEFFEEQKLYLRGFVRRWGEKPYNGLDYFEELAGPGGIWVCFFVPPQDKKDAQKVADVALDDMRRDRDIVRSNWCFLPEDVSGIEEVNHV
jgi:hypothetical protein